MGEGIRMTESTESATASPPQPVAEAPVGPVPQYRPSGRPNRLYQSAAWVAIVAGIVFIVGAIFFTGVALGRHAGHGGGWDRHRHQGCAMMPGPPMGHPEGRGPGMRGPGMGPGMVGPDDPEMRGPGVRPETPPPASSPQR